MEQLALALTLVFGGGVLMLLLGTQILHWYWLALLGAAGVTLGSARLRGRRLTPYRVAQMLDGRLQLSDSLSTAWFLLKEPERRDDTSARFQLHRAEEIAGSIRPARAFPFTGQRAWALTAALGAVVFGLFALRYLVTNSLSLREALVPIHFGAVFERLQNSLSAQNRTPELAALDPQQGKTQLTGPQENGGRSEVLQGQDLKAGKPDGTSASQPDSQNAGSQADNKPQDGKSESREGSPSTAQSNPGDKAEQAASEQSNSQQSPDTKEQSGNGQQGSSSGLVDKMKDALSSLMAKMRPNQNSQKSPQNGEKTPDDQKGGDQTSASKGQQGQQQDARNQQASQDQSSEAQAQGQTSEKAQASQGRSSDQSPEKGSDAHSGIGRQDGDKDVKEAEQLQAMGKLAEIIGKRSANLTGEMTVETPSGKQQLKTAYSQRLGHHSDLGGEINRDEIPLMYQQYIREYMEQVHKQGKSGQ